MHKPDIRPACAADLDALCRIEQACFAEDAFPRRVLAYLITEAQGGCFVVQHNGTTAGYISLLQKANTCNVRIYSIAIAPEYRGQGLSKILIAEALRFARAHGRTTITLEVRCDNTTAIALYEQAGFRRTRLLKEYYHSSGDGWRMELTLT